MISVVTTLSVAALPYVQQAAEKLAQRAGIEDNNAAEIINTTLVMSYALAQLGNLLIWLFVLLTAYNYGVPISFGEQVSLLSGFGSPSSSVDAVAFLTDWLNLPGGANGLYVGMVTITRYGQVLASVMGFAFVAFLVTMSYYNRLAHDLNVRLRLVPFTWSQLEEDLENARFDIAVGGI